MTQGSPLRAATLGCDPQSLWDRRHNLNIKDTERKMRLYEWHGIKHFVKDPRQKCRFLQTSVDIAAIVCIIEITAYLDLGHNHHATSTHTRNRETRTE